MIGSACWVEVAGERVRGVIVREESFVLMGSYFGTGWLVKLDKPIFILEVGQFDHVLEHKHDISLES